MVQDADRLIRRLLVGSDVNLPELEQHADTRHRSNRHALVIIAFVVVLVVAWTHGTFDNFLWRVHLNYTTCAQNGFGATFCGKTLDEYNQRLQQAGVTP